MADVSSMTGSYVGEFTGKVISKHNADKILKAHRADTWWDSYLVKLCSYHYQGTPSSLFLDSSNDQGNLTSYIRHSKCKPNCEFQRWYVNKLPRIAIYTTTSVQQGEFFTVSYEFSECYSPQNTPLTCLCGSTTCTARSL
jgi:hypothetical protein